MMQQQQQPRWGEQDAAGTVDHQAVTLCWEGEGLREGRGLRGTAVRYDRAVGWLIDWSDCVDDTSASAAVLMFTLTETETETDTDTEFITHLRLDSRIAE